MTRPRWVTVCPDCGGHLEPVSTPDPDVTHWACAECEAFWMSVELRRLDDIERSEHARQERRDESGREP